jgi:hypothetical protein
LTGGETGGKGKKKMAPLFAHDFVLFARTVDHPVHLVLHVGERGGEGAAERGEKAGHEPEAAEGAAAERGGARARGRGGALRLHGRVLPLRAAGVRVEA